ncbi:MAG: hypothetical protein MUE60_12290 [Candidatus Eisenbacteria bacterium]|nr:hypothetical protein [Candidatus Eisenbacteria bacterium]
MPALQWDDAPTPGSPNVAVHVKDNGSNLSIGYTGAVTTPEYLTTREGLHWDFGKVFTTLALPQLCRIPAVALHAAVLGHGRDEAVLLPGSSGAGKSAISIAALGLGKEVLASELAFVGGARIIAGNSQLTIDPRALDAFEFTIPGGARSLNGRVVIDLPECSLHHIVRVAFPKVTFSGLRVREITSRRARMLLFENAVSQLGMSQLVAQETHPLGCPPVAEELEIMAQQVVRLSGSECVIVEGRPEEIAAFVTSGEA